MIDISQVPVGVLETINNATEGGREIENMTPKEALNLYLKWHGIIGYTDQIVDALDSLRAAEVKS
ncbi:MAG: hypothetical protein WC479_08515 [Candidatus Izemoplasmatales bacterium]